VAYPGDDRPDVAGVLADRLAAALVHHEPGWRLPRPSALARRYDVRPAQVEAAVRELAARHLIRQLPDGQLYRASPAEFLVPIQGVRRLGAHVDPMGSDVTCRSRKVTWRRAPEDVGWALGVPATAAVCTVKCHWVINADPAAISTTYLTEQAAGQLAEITGGGGGMVADLLMTAPLHAADDLSPLGVPAALHLEMQPPPSSVARGLRLGAGQPAVMVTVRFDVPGSDQPVALTVAALRADLFRIVVDLAGSSVPLRAVVLADALSGEPLPEDESLDEWTAMGKPAVGQ
jgi:hypothetical protein